MHVNGVIRPASSALILQGEKNSQCESEPKESFIRKTIEFSIYIHVHRSNQRQQIIGMCKTHDAYPNGWYSVGSVISNFTYK